MTSEPTTAAAQRHIFSCRYGFAPCECEPSTEGDSMPNLPEGVTDTFTFTCECEGTISVVGGVQQAHDCPLTEAQRQAIRDAAADALEA